jgi:hypothetical protein
MTRSSIALLVAAFLSFDASRAPSAFALGEMLGKWHLLSVDGPQELELFADGGRFNGQYQMSGTVDQVTGEVHLSGYAYFWTSCEFPTSLHGWISQDGRSLEATADWAWRDFGAACSPFTVNVQGTRCGNGILDSWEECDARPWAYDCCSSECLFEDEGFECSADSNPCTDHICDGAGTCETFPNSAACTADGNCGTGVCADSACEVTEPFETGTPCDLDESVCTPDACDGAGQCAAAPPIDCSPCADYCDSTVGCYVEVPSEVNECDWNLSARLDVQTGEDEERSLKLGMRRKVAAGELGDPTTTSYTLCLFRDLVGVVGVEAGRIEIPVDDGCGDDDCWEPLSKGFSYRKEDTSGDGELKARLTPRGIRMKATGATVTVPSPLPGLFSASSSNGFLTKFVASDGASQACWMQSLAPTIDTTDRFKGRGRPTIP